MSVNPDFNCCDPARTKCLKIKPCSYFCLDQRWCSKSGNCCGTTSSTSCEDYTTASGGAKDDDFHNKLLGFGDCHCCGYIQVGDSVTIKGSLDTYTVLAIEAGKVTIGTDTLITGNVLELNGINGHLCSVKLVRKGGSEIVPILFDVVRSHKDADCNASSCNSCGCAC